MPYHRRPIIQLEEDTPELAELRKVFEQHITDPRKKNRSRKGVYSDPPTQRDWKWFKAGFSTKLP